MSRGRLNLEAVNDDVFADGSAVAGGICSPHFVPVDFTSGQQNVLATGTFDGIEKLVRAMGISSTHRRRIVPNPPAAVIREREYRHGPWMKRTNRRIEVETSKAEAVIFEKRIFDLAKQAVASLQVVGVRCEMTTIANMLRVACKYRALGKDQQTRLLEKKKREAEQACWVLDSCLRFDSRGLAALLGLTIKRKKTFGAGVPV